jgi:hypothetical protein
MAQPTTYLLHEPVDYTGDGITWNAGVVTVVDTTTQQVTYGIKLLDDRTTMSQVGENRLQHREVRVSYRSSEDEDWKEGVVVKHHLSAFTVTETFDIQPENGGMVEQFVKRENIKGVLRGQIE